MQNTSDSSRKIDLLNRDLFWSAALALLILSSAVAGIRFLTASPLVEAGAAIPSGVFLPADTLLAVPSLPALNEDIQKNPGLKKLLALPAGSLWSSKPPLPLLNEVALLDNSASLQALARIAPAIYIMTRGKDTIAMIPATRALSALAENLKVQNVRTDSNWVIWATSKAALDFQSRLLRNPVNSVSLDIGERGISWFRFSEADSEGSLSAILSFFAIPLRSGQRPASLRIKILPDSVMMDTDSESRGYPYAGAIPRGMALLQIDEKTSLWYETKLTLNELFRSANGKPGPDKATSGTQVYFLGLGSDSGLAMPRMAVSWPAGSKSDWDFFKGAFSAFGSEEVRLPDGLITRFRGYDYEWNQSYMAFTPTLRNIRDRSVWGSDPESAAAVSMVKGKSNNPRIAAVIKRLKTPNIVSGFYLNAKTLLNASVDGISNINAIYYPAAYGDFADTIRSSRGALDSVIAAGIFEMNGARIEGRIQLWL